MSRRNERHLPRDLVEFGLPETVDRVDEDEDLRLVALAQQGDDSARDRLWQLYALMVYSTLRDKFRIRFSPDEWQSMFLSLAKAIETFDASKGGFRTHLIQKCRWDILTLRARDRLIPLRTHQIAQFKRDSHDLSDEAKECVRRVLDGVAGTKSLLAAGISSRPDDSARIVEARDMFQRLVKAANLNPKEALYWWCIYDADGNQIRYTGDVAREHGVSRQAVCYSLSDGRQKIQAAAIERGFLPTHPVATPVPYGHLGNTPQPHVLEAVHKAILRLAGPSRSTNAMNRAIEELSGQTTGAVERSLKVLADRGKITRVFGGGGKRRTRIDLP